MSRSLLAVAVLALAVCVAGVDGGRAVPTKLQSLQPVLSARASTDAGVAVQASTESAAAVAVATWSPVAGMLGSGVWLHESPADRTLLGVASQATDAPDDGRHGLATKSAPRAHYATLRVDNTYDRSAEYCASVGGALCTYQQICPRGAGHSAIGAREIPYNRRSWAPIKDSVNEWVNMEPGPYGGKKDRCARAANPHWGRIPKPLGDIDINWDNHSKSLVACCNRHGGVMRSYLRPGAKLPGRNDADAQEGKQQPRFRIPVNVLGPSHIGPWGDVNVPLRGSGAQWIWNDPNAVAGAPAQVRPLKFQLRYHAEHRLRARMVFVVDDFADVFLNGARVGAGGGGWGKNGKLSEVQLDLKKGMNSIEFHAKNGGGPAGIIAAAFNPAGAKLFITDKSWTVERKGV